MINQPVQITVVLNNFVQTPIQTSELKRSVNFEMSFWCYRLDQNSNKSIVRISALKFFVASQRLLGDLVSNIINKKAYRKLQKASRKPQGRYTKFQGRNLYNIFIDFLVQMMTPKRHFEINWPLNWQGNDARFVNQDDSRYYDGVEDVPHFNYNQK